MGGVGPEEQWPIHEDQLAWKFEDAARQSMAIAKGPEIFRALGRQMVTRMVKHSVNSAQAIEIAFESVLNDFKEELSPYAQGRLLEYLIDHMPAEQTDYTIDDPYFNATVASFGMTAVFKHIVQGVGLSNPDQLTFDTSDGYESAGSS